MRAAAICTCSGIGGRPRVTQPCATLSMLAYYQTSRSLHFPVGAVCSLSGAQPEITSVSWWSLVSRRQLVGCLLFLSIHWQRSGVPARRRVSGPRAPLARSTRAIRPEAHNPPLAVSAELESGPGWGPAPLWHCGPPLLAGPSRLPGPLPAKEVARRLGSSIIQFASPGLPLLLWTVKWLQAPSWSSRLSFIAAFLMLPL